VAEALDAIFPANAIAWFSTVAEKKYEFVDRTGRLKLFHS